MCGKCVMPWKTWYAPIIFKLVYLDCLPTPAVYWYVSYGDLFGMASPAFYLQLAELVFQGLGLQLGMAWNLHWNHWRMWSTKKRVAASWAVQSLAFATIYCKQFGWIDIAAFSSHCICQAPSFIYPGYTMILSLRFHRLWGQAMAPKRKAWELRLASRIGDSDGKTGTFNMSCRGAKDQSNPSMYCMILYVIFGHFVTLEIWWFVRGMITSSGVRVYRQRPLSEDIWPLL